MLRNWLLRPVLQKLDSLERQITMNMTELAQALSDAAAQAAKSKAEIIAKVQALEDAIAAGATTPEVDAALAALKGEVQGLDDLNADPAP